MKKKSDTQDRGKYQKKGKLFLIRMLAIWEDGGLSVPQKWKAISVNHRDGGSEMSPF